MGVRAIISVLVLGLLQIEAQNVTVEAQKRIRVPVSYASTNYITNGVLLHDRPEPEIEYIPDSAAYQSIPTKRYNGDYQSNRQDDTYPPYVPSEYQYQEPQSTEESSYERRAQNFLGNLNGYTHYKSSQSFNLEGPSQIETIQTNSYHSEVEPYETSSFEKPHHHEHDEEHAEVHYHQHKHVHKHHHKQEHHHKHKQDHKHDHDHKHNHHHGHEHKHDHGHKHDHSHKHGHHHKAEHQHKHHQQHQHKHHQDHKHDHHHHQEHKHDHHHGHKHDHHSEHKHKHHQEHKHDHHHGHKHHHDNQHKHDQHHKHEHKHSDHHKHKHLHHKH